MQEGLGGCVRVHVRVCVGGGGGMGAGWTGTDASQDEHRICQKRGKTVQRMRHQFHVSIPYLLHRGKLHFTRNPSPSAQQMPRSCCDYAVSAPGAQGTSGVAEVRALRQMSGTGDELLALPQPPPLESGPKEGDLNPLSLCPRTPLRGKDPASGFGFWAPSLPFLALGL